MPNGECHKSGNLQVWWLNGQFHRTDGPAYIDTRTGGRKAWWLNSVCYRGSYR